MGSINSLVYTCSVSNSGEIRDRLCWKKKVRLGDESVRDFLKKVSQPQLLSQVLTLCGFLTYKIILSTLLVTHETLRNLIYSHAFFFITGC